MKSTKRADRVSLSPLSIAKPYGHPVRLCNQVSPVLHPLNLLCVQVIFRFDSDSPQTAMKNPFHVPVPHATSSRKMFPTKIFNHKNTPSSHRHITRSLSKRRTDSFLHKKYHFLRAPRAPRSRQGRSRTTTPRRPREGKRRYPGHRVPRRPSPSRLILSAQMWGLPCPRAPRRVLTALRSVRRWDRMWARRWDRTSAIRWDRTSGRRWVPRWARRWDVWWWARWGWDKMLGWTSARA
mmetsp:Transcript_1524/g.3246  ORF Transcript_1524/g.3246 Transcript_1524/m.3246 type:complete len:237 (-) Transcript_1524:686-1396(-)